MQILIICARHHFNFICILFCSIPFNRNTLLSQTFFISIYIISHVIIFICAAVA